VQTVPRRGYRFIADVAPAAVVALAPATAPETSLEPSPASRAADSAFSPFSNFSPFDPRPRTQPVAQPVPPPALWTPWLPWLGCFVAGLAVGILALALQAGPKVGDAPLARFSVDLPDGLTLSGPSSLAMSSNGQLLTALLEDGHGRRAVYARALDSGVFQRIPGSDDARFAFVSPDGERVGLWIADRLRAVHLRTGMWSSLGTAHLLRGASWMDDGSLWIASEADGALRRIGPRGGAPLVVARPHRDAGESTYDAPIGLAGSGLVFAAARPGQEPLLYGWPASASSPRPLGPGTAPRWVGPAHVVYRRGEQVQAALFLPPDWTLLRPTTLARLGRADGSVPWAATGDAMVRPPACRDCDVPLVQTVGGATKAVTVPGTALESWQLSTDGTQVFAISRVGDDRQVWRVDVGDGTPTLIERGAGHAVATDASGQHTAIASHDRDGWVVRQPETSGSGAALLHRADVPVTPSSIGPTGVVWMHQPNARGDLDVWSVSPGSRAVTTIATPANEWQAMPSPDGRHLAYLTDARGDIEVVVRELASSATIGTWPASEVRWSPDGALLLVRDGRHWQALALPASSEDSARPSSARPATGLHAVALPSGLRLPASAEPATTLDFVLQWAREVRQQVPVAPRPLPVVR